MPSRVPAHDSATGNREPISAGRPTAPPQPANRADRIRAYAVAAAAVVVIAGLRFLLEPVWKGRLPFQLFALSTAIAAWFGGLWPGLAAMVAGLLVGKLLFMPEGSREGLGADWGLILAYLIISSITVVLFELFHRSRRRGQLYVAQLEEDQREQAEARRQREQLMEQLTHERERLRESLEMLAESEQRYRSIGELIPYGFWMADPQGRVTYLSQSFLNLVGLSMQEACERGWMDRIPEEDRDRTVSDWQHCIATRGKWEYEHRILGRDGCCHTIMSRGVPVCNVAGEVDCWVGIHFDITDRKRDEEALQLTLTMCRQAEQARRDSEERYRRLIELSPDAVVVHDSERVIYANTATLQMLGAKEPAQVIGRPVTDFVQRDYRQIVAGRIRFMRETGQVAPLLDEKWVKLDGTVFDVEVTSVSLPWEGRTAFQVVARDITERRRVAAELTRYRERLEELVMERTEALRQSEEQLRRSERLASLGTLAAGIAHEINNPLNSIILTADYALQFPAEVEPDRAYETIIKEAQRGGRIVKSVMKFARKDVSPKSPHQLNEVVARAVELVRTYVHSTRLRLDLNLAPNLPTITLSPEEIEQVIINLVQNAVEAAKGEVQVKLITEREGDHVRLAVEDNGPGISEDNLQRIFDPFFSTRHSAGGTGLGLSICHAIVAEHGGSILVQSRLAEGTRFTVRLPVSEGAEETPEPGAQRR